jgi:hypothetical protein
MKTKSLLASLAVFALLVCLVMACLHPLLTAPGDLLVGSHRQGQNDLSTSFIAYHGFPAYCLRQFGQLPGWNPYKFSGAPYHGAPESGAFYPANWLVWLTGDVTSLGWIIAAHLLLGGLGAYRLSRGYAMHVSAACAAAVIYAAAPFLIVQAAEGHYTLICAAAWIPWAFWAFERMRKGSIWAFPLLAAILALCFFAGHAQTAYYLVVILSLLRLVDVAQMYFRQRRQEGLRAAGQWVALGLTVGGLVAIDLLPIWSYTRYTIRGNGLSLAGAGAIHVGLVNLLQLVYPAALGDADSYAGPGKYYWETLCYFGIAPLVLAAVGVAARWRKPFVRQWGGVAVATWLFAAGVMGGLFPLCYLLLPGCAMFRAPSRTLLFCSLAVALLASAGVQFVVQAMRVRSRRASARRGGNSASEPKFAAVSMIAVIALHPRLKLPVGPILVGICGLELALFGSGRFASLERGRLHSSSPIVAFLQAQEGVFRVAAPQSLLSDYEACTAGIEKVQAFDPAPPTLHTAVALQTAHGDADAVMQRELFGFTTPAVDAGQSLWLDLMNVRFVVLPAASSPQKGWKLVSQGQIAPRFGAIAAEESGAKKAAGRQALKYAIYERPNVLPRAFVLGDVRMVSSMKQCLANLAALRPRRQLLLDQDVLPQGPRQPFAAAEILRFTPNRVELRAALEKPGYLYLGDAWLPGWTAEENGAPLPVLRANAAFRAVPLEAGQHLVVLRFVPRNFAVGRWLSAVSLACLAAWCLARWWKEKSCAAST